LKMGDRRTDFSVIGFKNHKDYLDSFTSKKDTMYLSNKETARRIVELGYRSTNVPYEEKEFEKRLDIAMQALRPKITGLEHFSIYMPENCKDPVLLEFKKREDPIYNKQLATIVFTSYVDSEGSEISGYLDLGMSWANTRRRAMRHTNWRAVYEGHDRLEPMPHHLSYSNQRSNILLYTNSDNFKVLHDHTYGMMFQHKGDHKIIPVGGKPNPFSKNVKRSMAIGSRQTVVFYDHIVRKKV
ncbi:hypothetical protein KR222_003096, partial [Zaprionus bogoriensis]